MREISKQTELCVLVNNSRQVQEIFDTNYLRTSVGTYEYEKLEDTVKKWGKLAEMYGFSVKEFPYIFFHRLCIIEYKDLKKKMCVADYIYKQGLPKEKHPRKILLDTDKDFNVYFEEYNFIWEKSAYVYKRPEE